MRSLLAKPMQLSVLEELAVYNLASVIIYSQVMCTIMLCQISYNRKCYVSV
ncbi:unnamed protein product [Schistosoma margrebowiei]|uniref:Uncharacterized protein n=1 Tax=Schistosoma margrebowiei TaxID=48269 RepID=A0A3P7ZUV2_9TREM|nr:unnamed protein product [Schistosoma margrebowiei]